MGSYPFGQSLHSHGSRQNLAIARESHRQELRRPPGPGHDYPPSIHSSLASHDDQDISADHDTPDSRPNSPVDISVNIRNPTLPTPVPGSDPAPPTSDQDRLSILPERSASPDHAPSHYDTSPPSPNRSAHPHPHFANDLPGRAGSPSPFRGRPRTRPATPSTLHLPSRTASPSLSRAGSPTPSVTALRSAHIFPAAPESFSRYHTRNIVKPPDPKSAPEPLLLPPFTTDFMRDTPVPKRWKFIVHPEGQPHFVHQARCFKVYTDADIFDNGIRQRIERDIYDIQAKIISAEMHTAGSTYDLAVETYFDTEDRQWLTAYYLADHSKKTIFFVDAFDMRRIKAIEGLAGVEELRHIQFELAAQYWHHVQSYPTCRLLTREDLCALRDDVMHNIGDITTSPYSTSPYSLKELHEILSLLTPLEKNLDTVSPGSLTLVARFKAVFARSRFLHWHGLTCARLERTVSVYGKLPKTTWLLKGISPFLFSAPDVVHRWLQKIWTDDILHKAVFEDTIAKMNGEWQELILFATVLLATNVGFLAIGSVDSAGGNSATQIASYISTLTSTGSVTLGLLLARQTKTKNRECADQMQGFLKRKHHAVYGLEILAILYSLPYALIMWSVISFLAAFSLFVFFGGGTASRVVFSVCMASIVTFFVWCIVMGWETEPPPEDQFDVPRGSDAISIRSMPPSTSTVHHPPDGHITPSETHTGSRTVVSSPDPITVETPLERFLDAIGLRRRQSPRKGSIFSLGTIAIVPPDASPDRNV